jgi:hypothetical protein
MSDILSVYEKERAEELSKWRLVVCAAMRHKHNTFRISVNFADRLIRRMENAEEEAEGLHETIAELYASMEKLVGVKATERITSLEEMIKSGTFFCPMCGDDDQGKYPDCGCEARINNEFQNGGLESCGMGCHGCALCE